VCEGERYFFAIHIPLMICPESCSGSRLI